MNNLAFEKTGDGIVFTVKVVPGSRQTCVCGLHGEMVRIKISEAPEKGKANKCLVDFLAKKLSVKKNAISIISGKTRPVKVLRVVGISVEQLLNKLNLNK